MRLYINYVSRTLTHYNEHCFTQISRLECRLHHKSSLHNVCIGNIEKKCVFFILRISNATVELPSQPVIAIGTKIIKSEALIFGSEGLTLYLLYIRNVGLGLTVACVIGLSLTKALAIYANTWLSEWSTHPGANEPNTRSLYLGAYAAIAALQGLAIFLSYTYSAFGARNAARVLHNKMLHTTMRLPMSFFDTTPLGRISNR